MHVEWTLQRRCRRSLADNAEKAVAASATVSLKRLERTIRRADADTRLVERAPPRGVSRRAHPESVAILHRERHSTTSMPLPSNTGR